MRHRARHLQLAIRHRAESLAYQVFGILVIAGAVYALVAGFIVVHLWLPRTAGDLGLVAAALFLLYTTLPSAVIAWTEPDTSGELAP